MDYVLALKTDIVDKIKSDPILYGQIAAAMNVSIATVPRIFSDNDRILDGKRSDSTKLTDAKTLRVLRDYLGVAQDNELLEEIQQETSKVA